METVIWLNEQQIDVLCMGVFTVEQAGYYAGTGSVENFKVFHNNENITAQIDADELAQLESDYIQHCFEECA